MSICNHLQKYSVITQKKRKVVLLFEVVYDNFKNLKAFSTSIYRNK